MARDNHKIYSTLTGLGVLGLNTFGAEAGLTVGAMLGAALLEGSKSLLSNLLGSSVDHLIQEKLLADAAQHPNEMNHDLHEALGVAMQTTFQNLHILYQEKGYAVPEMAENLAGIADLRFDLGYDVTPEAQAQTDLQQRVAEVLELHQKALGEPYLRFFHETFKTQFAVCLGEQLKINNRAWIDFQRSIYANLNEQGREILAKQDQVLVLLESAGNAGVSNTALDQKLDDAITQLKGEWTDLRDGIEKIGTLAERIDQTTQTTAAQLTALAEKLSPQPQTPFRLTAIPKHDGKVFGRDAQVKKIRERFQKKQPVLLVNGIGGIGKSTVAMHYCAEFGDAYTHIAWLQLADAQYANPQKDKQARRSLLKAFGDVTLLQNLELPLDHGLDEEKLFQVVLAKLGNLKPQVLLVLDNANDASEIQQYKHALLATNADVLFTSRTQPELWHEHDCLRIDQLPIDEAWELFRTFYTRPADETAVKAFLETKLHCHTLLMQLVAKVAQARNLPFAKLEAKYKTLKMAERTIQQHIETTFQELSALDEAPRKVLRSFTLLPPNRPISAELLAQLTQTEEEATETYLGALVAQGWLDTTRLEAGGMLYAIHPLIHETATRLLPLSLEEAMPFVEEVATLIHYSNVDPTHNLFTIAQNQDLAEFLLALPILQNTDAPEVSYLKDRLASLYEHFGQYKIAAKLGEEALDSAIKHFGQDHPKVAVSQSNLANVYGSLGRYAEAASLLEAALASDLKQFGQDHPTVAVRQSNLANVYSDLGRYDKAAGLLERALDSDIKQFGQDHPTVAVDQSNLANVYGDLGRYAEAAGLLETALDSAIKHFGQDHPTVAVRQSNLATVYLATERYAEAIVLWEQALANVERSLGTAHPHYEAIAAKLQVARAARA